jgi:TetR/AcrR family transcriptional regulator
VQQATGSSPDPKGVCATERILRAAERLFSELGYDAVSTSAIAAHADVSKANIYHHFASKRSLYLAVLSNGCKKPAGKLLDELTRSSGSLTEQLRHFIRAHISNLHNYEHVSRLILREVVENRPGRGQELAEQIFGDNFSRLVGILRDSQQRGELRADIHPAMAATLLLGANVFFFQSQEVLRHLPDVSFADDQQGYGCMVADILLNGLLTAQARSARDKGPS